MLWSFHTILNTVFTYGLHICRKIFSVLKMSNVLQLDLSLDSRNFPMRKDYGNWGSQHWKSGDNKATMSATRFYQGSRTLVHISPSNWLIIFTVFVVTVSSYPSTDAILISKKTSLVKESLMLGTHFSNYAESGCQQISKNNNKNVFSYHYAYRFILIFLFAISITPLMNEILLELFTVRLIVTVVTRLLVFLLTMYL